MCVCKSCVTISRCPQTCPIFIAVRLPTPTHRQSTSERQPLSSRPQRGAAAKARFGFAANENNTQAAAASTSGGSTIKGAGVVIPRRRPAAASSASASVATEDDKVVAEAPMAEAEAAVEEEAPVVLVSQIEEMATRAFEDGEGTELGELARGKLRLATSNKFDYKEKVRVGRGVWDDSFHLIVPRRLGF